MTMEKSFDRPIVHDSPWNDGWLTTAHPFVSPNFGERPMHATVDLVVLHSISLPPGSYGNSAIFELFTNRLKWDTHPYFESIRGLQVSTHFYITRLGVLWQFVSCNQRAWHAGVSSYRGKNNCNDDSIGIELEGTDTDLFTPQQYAALRTLCHHIQMVYPITYLAGHEHIAPGRKTDPGTGMDWDSFKAWPELKGWELPS